MVFALVSVDHNGSEEKRHCKEELGMEMLGEKARYKRGNLWACSSTAPNTSYVTYDDVSRCCYMGLSGRILSYDAR